MNLNSCPVCKKQYLKQGLKNHIIVSASFEAHKQMKNLFNHHKRNFYSVSRTVLLRNMPHFAFIRRNTKLSNKKILII